jgi:N utilization substance protein A
VDDTQLSLAIGKKGQNVRLAARLVGWHVDIKSEEEKRQEIESQMAAMALRGAAIEVLEGLGEKTIGKLQAHGLASVEQLAQMTPEELIHIPGIGEKTVEKIRRVVTDYFEHGGEAAAASEAEADAGTAVAPTIEEQVPAEATEAEPAPAPQATETVTAESGTEAVATAPEVEPATPAAEAAEGEAKRAEPGTDVITHPEAGEGGETK